MAKAIKRYFARRWLHILSDDELRTHYENRRYRQQLNTWFSDWYESAKKLGKK